MKTISLDFDGTLHSYALGWQGPRNIYGKPVNGAIEFLLSAMDHFDVAIHSSRSRYLGGRRAMKKWLLHWLVEYRWTRGCRIETKHPYLTAMDMQDEYRRWAREVVSKISFPLWKPPAFVTLDDRALTFTGTWPSMEDLLAFKPWNKRGD